MTHVNKLFQEWRDTSAAADDGVIGCTDDEIAEIERLGHGRLPEVYKDFMLLAGRNAGPPLRGTDCTYPVVLQLRIWASEILEETKCGYLLPDEMFVFAVHQGYEFRGFMLDQGSDPPVLQFVEGINLRAPLVSWPSFSAYLGDLLGSCVDATRRWGKNL